MEIDITDFVRNADMFDFFHSVAEGGVSAGRDTWHAAMAHTPHMLVTEEQLDAMRHWASETGAWSDAEISAWSPNEVNALFHQLVAGDIREAEGIVGSSVSEWSEAEWSEYQELSQAGTISGSFYGGALVDATSDRIWYGLE